MKQNLPTVSEDVLQRIADAIDEIASNDDLQRTKKQIERLTGLSHPTVARAFAQDLRETTPYAITARLAALHPVSKGMSPKQLQERQEKSDVDTYRKRIVELEAERDLHLQALYAYFISTQPNDFSQPVTYINRKAREARP